MQIFTLTLVLFLLAMGVQALPYVRKVFSSAGCGGDPDDVRFSASGACVPGEEPLTVAIYSCNSTGFYYYNCGSQATCYPSVCYLESFFAPNTCTFDKQRRLWTYYTCEENIPKIPDVYPSVIDYDGYPCAGNVTWGEFWRPNACAPLYGGDYPGSIRILCGKNYIHTSVFSDDTCRFLQSEYTEQPSCDGSRAKRCGGTW